MESNERCTVPALLPDLPDHLVLTHVITRLPWHARPVCRAVSTTWRASIDASTKCHHLLLKSRHHLLPFLQGNFLVCTIDYQVFISDTLRGPLECRRTRYHCAKWGRDTYQVCKQWRKLPSPGRYLPQPPDSWTTMASCGMLYAWSDQKHRRFVLKMDMAAGCWTWKKISVPYPFDALAVPYNAKIYVPGIETQEGTESNAVLEHDMMDEQFGLIKTWNIDNLRVLSTNITGASLEGGVQELYSFVEHRLYPEPELEILVHDACKDSWRTKVVIPFPYSFDIENTELVKMDCLEPAPNGGINIVCADPDAEVLSWFSSSLRAGWVEFDFNGSLKNKNLEDLEFIHGQLYGIFVEDKCCVDKEPEKNRQVDKEKQQDPWLYKRTIMKGTMVIGTRKVHWEEVLDVGCFIDAYYFPQAVIPIIHFTLMA